MISIFGSTLAATSPWLLLGIPCAIGLLMYIFRVRGTAHQAVVSSLLFLQELPRRPIGRKVFVPPLQFWLELAILTLLILATAGIFLTRSGKHVAVVVDSSLSMGALYGSGGTRLEQAKRIAGLDINRAADSTNYTVFSSSNDLAPVTNPHESRSDALTAIQSVSQSYRADALQEHVTSLLSDPAYDTVWVYTDRELQSGTANLKLVVNQIPVEPATQTNAWIRSVQAREGNTLSVGIGYGGSAPREALVDGECYEEGSQKPLKISPQAVRLTPQEGATATLIAPSTRWSYCRTHVRLQDASLFDSLPLDNEGWITNSPSASTILVTGSLTPEQLGLTKIPSLRFVTSATDAGNQLPTIFHRQAPTTTPTTPSLVVLPPVGALTWGGGALERSSQAREISRWDQSHPILTYINPALITLSEARPLECPPTSTPVLFIAAGPIACAGEDRDARYVITGFELFPFDGAKDPAVSILTLNIFKWLFQSAASSSSGSLPASLPVPQDVTTVEYVQPSTSALPINANAISPKQPGVIRLQNRDSARNYLALNAFEDTESNLSQSTLLTIQPQGPAPRADGKAKSSYDLLYILATLALLVLAADLMRRIARRVRWGDA